MADGIATSRIPLTPTTYQELKDFRSGLGVTFDDAIILLLELAKKPSEDAFSAGRRLQTKLKKDKD